MKFMDLPLDVNGIPFSNPTFWLDTKEYRKITHEINQIYNAQYAGRQLCAHASFGIDGVAYIYWFENHGFDNYNIYLRVMDNH